MRAEDNARGASEYHGAGGPLHVAEQRSPRPLNERLLAASEAAGIPRIADYNGPEQDGASMFQVTQKNGRRFSAADAYLRPALTRPNLEVRTSVTVLGVELEGRPRRRRAPAQGARRRGARARRARGAAERRGDRLAAAAAAVGHRRARGAARRRRRGPPRAARRRAQPPGPPVPDRPLGGLRRRTPCTAPTSPGRWPSGCCANRASSARPSPRSSPSRARAGACRRRTSSSTWAPPTTKTTARRPTRATAW